MDPISLAGIGSVLGGLGGLLGRGGGGGTNITNQVSNTSNQNTSISAAISPVIFAQAGSPSASPQAGSSGAVTSPQTSAQSPYAGTPSLPSYLPGSTSYGPTAQYPIGYNTATLPRATVAGGGIFNDPLFLILLIGGVAAVALTA